MLGTSAMMTCMAMDAAMMGPMPTWKKGTPLPRMALSPQPPPRGRGDGHDGVDKLAEHVPSHLRAGRGGEVLHRELRAQAYEHDVEERVQHAPSPVVCDLLLHILERVLLLLQLAPG
jgi:hypothetical protein